MKTIVKKIIYAAILINLMTQCQSSPNLCHFKHTIIDPSHSSPQKPYGKAIGDLSGDGFPDILISSANGDGINWYEFPTWIKHTIRDTGSWSEDVQIADIDGDGAMDIINGNRTALFWYRNPLSPSGNPGTEKWDAIKIGSDGSDIHDIEIGDLNGDHKLDIAIRYEKEYKRSVQIYLQQSPSSFMEIIDVNHSNLRAEGLCLADINQDKHLDIIIGNVWCENNGDGTKWIEHIYATGLPDQLMIQVGDINKDDSPNIVVCPQSSAKGAFAWFKSEPQKELWKERIIQEKVSRMHGLALADFNLDGSLDIHTSLRHDLKGIDDNVSIWINNGKTIPNFSEQVLSKNGSHFSKVGDIGADGDLDIIGANWSSKAPNGAPIELWENLIINQSNY